MKAVLKHDAISNMILYSCNLVENWFSLLQKLNGGSAAEWPNIRNTIYHYLNVFFLLKNIEIVAQDVDDNHAFLVLNIKHFVGKFDFNFRQGQTN